MEIIGHRGFAEQYPENTVPSLLAALAAGARSLEWDVRFSSCGTPVLFHDRVLDRTTDGQGPLAEFSMEELSRLDAGGWRGEEFSGTRIPLLEEVLGMPELQGAHALFCEVKEARSPAHLSTLLSLIWSSPVADRTVLISLDFDLLHALRRLDSTIPLGWVVEDEAALAPALQAVRRDGAALLDPRYTLLLRDPERTRQWVREGLPLATWTVDHPADAHALVSLGVTRLTTNRVSTLVEGLP